VTDTATGAILPFEQTLASEWNVVGDAKNMRVPDDIPNDVWPYGPGKYRFYVADLRPGEKKKYELANVKNISRKPVKASRYFKPVLDNGTGTINNIVYLPLNKLLFDEKTGQKPAELIVERPQGAYSRTAMDERKYDSNKFLRSSPEVIKHAQEDSNYALRYASVLQEPFARRIEQQWDIFDSTPRIEITTTIWMKENLDALAVYMAFPFSIKSPRVFYDSMGSEVEAGVDQLPNTCGEFNTVQNGIRYKGEDISLSLTTLDSPMGIFDEIIRGRFRPVFKPQTGRFYNIICQNYWLTNFAVLQPVKIITRHVIECDMADKDVFPVESTELWAYPSV
nr:hypothetical protein [Chitinophagaceae bacterium]